MSFGSPESGPEKKTSPVLFGQPPKPPRKPPVDVTTAVEMPREPAGEQPDFKEVPGSMGYVVKELLVKEPRKPDPLTLTERFRSGLATILSAIKR